MDFFLLQNYEFMLRFANILLLLQCNSNCYGKETQGIEETA